MRAKETARAPVAPGEMTTCRAQGGGEKLWWKSKLNEALQIKQTCSLL